MCFPEELLRQGARRRLGVNQVEQRIPLAQLGGAGLGAEGAVGAVGAVALNAGAEVEGANVVAPPAVGAGFFRVGKLHGARSVGLQQQLDQCIRAAFLTEVLLIVHEESHEAKYERGGYSNEGQMAGCYQPELVI